MKKTKKTTKSLRTLDTMSGNDLLRALYDVADDDEAEAIRALVHLLGFIWTCQCGWDNMTGVMSKCENCGSKIRKTR